MHVYLAPKMFRREIAAAYVTPVTSLGLRRCAAESHVMERLSGVTIEYPGLKDVP